ncbi:nADH dehydrogenase (Quinone) [Clostridium sp. CAG:678]|nr:nADH dehydrogenase (Quinone) [Clostridium sp. CAG:678]
MTISELNAIKERNRDIVLVRKLAASESEKLEKKTEYRKQVLVCGGTGCTSSGSKKVLKALNKELETQGIDDVLVVRTGCFGLCSLGPIMIVYPEGSFYSKVTAQEIPEIVAGHLKKGGKPINKYLYPETVHKDGSTIPLAETSFYKKQMRIALRNCGMIDPENIEEAIGTNAYQALAKVLTQMTPQQVIDELLEAGLRGRGGAGFPTGRKWSFAMAQENDTKYVCCNADEGDPGAFMDRSVLEGDPHAVIEAMAIAGYTIGAKQGFVYVRAEYPIAVSRLRIAIEQAREYGLLGKNILGTDFEFDIDIRLGAGAFVCGEETALMTSIEGNRGEPRPRPPYPAVKGLFGKPTILNNVETYANVAPIILRGAKWYSSIGTEKSKGTKVFALGGKINNVGLVEVPMGTTIREIVEEIGGGVPNGKKFKAAQTGGPSGGCISADYMDVPIDYDNLVEIGSMMGSGGMIILDEDTCMVDLAKFYLEFTVDESCGKCTPCRIGTRKLLDYLTRITDGTATVEDLDKIKELSNHMKSSSLCALGQTAANPILSTLNAFGEEYLEHIKNKRCPAHVCTALLSFTINPEKCRGCTLCARNCPVGAITGNVREPHTIDPDKCIKCGLCMSNCHFEAIEKR